MQPPDPSKAGEPTPAASPEKEPGQPIADCLRAIEQELEADFRTNRPVTLRKLTRA